MTEVNDLAGILALVDNAVAELGKLADDGPDVREREALRSVLPILKASREDVAATVPDAIAKMKAIAQGQLQDAERLKAEAARLRAEIDASKAKVAAARDSAREIRNRVPTVPEPPALPPIDPALGQSVRRELLSRFAPDALKSSGSSTGGKDIWQDWDWDRTN